MTPSDLIAAKRREMDREGEPVRHDHDVIWALLIEAFQVDLRLRFRDDRFLQGLRSGHPEIMYTHAQRWEEAAAMLELARDEEDALRRAWNVKEVAKALSAVGVPEPSKAALDRYEHVMRWFCEATAGMWKRRENVRAVRVLALGVSGAEAARRYGLRRSAHGGFKRDLMARICGRMTAHLTRVSEALEST